MLKRFLQIFILLIVIALGALVWFAWYASTPLLAPLAEEGAAEEVSRDSLSMEPVQAVSADGVTVEGFLVRSNADCAFSPGQERVRDALKMREKMKHLDSKPELVVICTTWDEGVQGSLSLAESLVGAGYTCLVWNPRGKDNCREFCTYGLKEYADVTALLDAVSARLKGLPPVAAVGQGFGAAVLFKAAVHDARIRCMVSLDCFPSLKTVAMREVEQDWGKALSFPAFWLLDAGVEWRADFSTFEIAPVDCALELDYPVMVVCTEQYFFSTQDDCLSIYDSLKNEKKRIFAPLKEGEPFGTKERTFVKTVEGKKGEKFEKTYKIDVYAGDDELKAGIAEWIYENTRMPMPKVLPGDSAVAPVSGVAPSVN